MVFTIEPIWFVLLSIYAGFELLGINEQYIS